jgi:hypothetical protein
VFLNQPYPYHSQSRLFKPGNSIQRLSGIPSVFELDIGGSNSVQTGQGAHPASYKRVVVLFLGVKAAGPWS